jgi:carbonic anhydrase
MWPVMGDDGPRPLYDLLVASDLRHYFLLYLQWRQRDFQILECVHIDVFLRVATRTCIDAALIIQQQLRDKVFGGPPDKAVGYSIVSIASTGAARAMREEPALAWRQQNGRSAGTATEAHFEFLFRMPPHRQKGLTFDNEAAKFFFGLLTCPVCASQAATQQWDYRENGPEGWASLDPAFRACGAGDQQSPVDLRDGIKADLPAIGVSLPIARVAVLNNGHTLQVSAPAGSSVDIGGSVVPLAQFHFHTPSEHSIAGKDAPMEVHFVYTHPDAAMTVLAALLVPGRRNAVLSAIMDVAPPNRDGKASVPMPIDARELLPAQLGSSWRYRGSLTTPPCTQTVDWIVFDNAVPVAEADIRRFRNIFPANARPRQPLNRRYLLRG